MSDAREIESAQNEIAREYIRAVMHLLAMSGHGEVNFVKKTIETDEGGIYLFQFQHVSGPKINLSALKAPDGAGGGE